MSSSPEEVQKLLRVGPPADQRGILRWLPGLYTLFHYKPAWLPRDLAAGLVLTAVLIPVGMAYAEAAGIPAIYGLYATIFPSSPTPWLAQVASSSSDPIPLWLP